MELIDSLVTTLLKYIPVSKKENVKKPKWYKLSAQEEDDLFGDFKLDRVVGRGRQCDVKLAWRDNRSYAIKLIPLKSIDEEFVESIGNELRSLEMYRHRHIICIHEAVLDDNYLGLVMEWARGGDLYQFLKLNGAIKKEEQIKQWFVQLISAVDYLQTESYVHCDIKPENILIDKEGKVILSDFEMGKSFKSQGFPFIDSPCGSLTYCAPEIILSGTSYDACKADIWALGVTLYVMVEGKLPFDCAEFVHTTPQEIFKQYRHIVATPLVFSESVSEPLKNVVSGMLEKNPTYRMSMPDIKRHPYLKEFVNLWDNQIPSALTRSAGSLVSDTSNHSSCSANTLDDSQGTTDRSKQLRGPVIWDPEACGRYLPAQIGSQENIW